MKKITFLALHLGYGGIEKCISTVANNLCDSYEVEIIVTYKLYEKPVFDLNPNIKVRYLIYDKPNRCEFITACKKFKLITAFKEGLKSINLLKNKKKKMIEAIKNCNSDIMISTRDIHNEWLGKYGKKDIIKIGWEHNFHNNNNKYINKIVKSVKDLDYFVLVSKEQQKFYSEIVKPECVYIPNSIEDYKNKFSQLENNNLISIGRLSKEKGFVDLIEVCSYVKEIIPNFKLNLVGDGVEKKDIEKAICKFHLEENIIMHGFLKTEEINKLLMESSIYVMTSFTESFGIVLLEAASYAIPAISFKNSGANEIISNNWDGYLIDNRDKKIMAKKIVELLKNKNRRIIMGRNAYKKCLTYSIDNVIEMWKKLLER